MESINQDLSKFQVVQRQLFANSTEPDQGDVLPYSFKLFAPGTYIRLQIMHELALAMIHSLYVFKLHYPRGDNFTHALYIKLSRKISPKRLDDFVDALIGQLTSGMGAVSRSINTCVAQHVSLLEFMMSLYVVPSNLIINQFHQSDALPYDLVEHSLQDHFGISTARKKMQTAATTILHNLMDVPESYPTTALARLLKLNETEFVIHMRASSLTELVTRTAKDAYTLALQDKSLLQEEVQAFMEPASMKSMMTTLMTETVVKRVQTVVLDAFNVPFVHPHPRIGLLRHKHLGLLEPLSGFKFDPRFMVPLMLVSRWFARTFLVSEKAKTNQGAHLVLYGGAGTGKSLLSSMIQAVIPTYRFLTGSKFQNPDLLQSSFLSIEEIDTQMLATNQYKQLLDIKAHVKVDFKNLHPENATINMPAILTTNDDVCSSLQGACGRKIGGSDTCLTQASVDAAFRRITMIPLKLGSFEKQHANDPSFQDEDLLKKMFNLMMYMALSWEDCGQDEMHHSLFPYVSALVASHDETVFAHFMNCQRQALHQVLSDFERCSSTDMDHQDGMISAVADYKDLVIDFFSCHTMDVPHISSRLRKNSSSTWASRVAGIESQFISTQVRDCCIKDYTNLNPFISGTMHAYRGLYSQMSDPLPGSADIISALIFPLDDVTRNHFFIGHGNETELEAEYPIYFQSD